MKRTCFIFGLAVLSMAACGARIGETPKPAKLDRDAFSGNTVVQQFHRSAEAPPWDSEDIDGLRRAIEASAEHGLNPADYHQGLLAESAIDQKDRELLAIDAYFTLATHLLHGKVDQQQFKPKWDMADEAGSLSAGLKQALESNRIEASLNALAPQHHEYVFLKRALAELKRKPHADDWTPIPPGPSLQPGERSKRVILIRERLLKKRDSDAEPSELYDETLASAVKAFQRNASLKPDGILGPDTIERLNTSQTNKRDIIRVNMERWRWLPRDLGERHVRVSIADYSLQAYDNGEAIGSHDVVVGKVYRQTPIFSDQMTHLVINPWWIVPHTLAVKDLLPKFQRDPDVIEKKHYQIRDASGEVLDPEDIDWEAFSEDDFPFEIRQKPGQENALGRIKFMFPNKFDVYLHDSPAQHLFDKTQRDFSSGCIRVEDPFLLAGWILQHDPDWNKQRLSDTVKDGKTVTVTLKTPLPVHLMYWTAVVKDDRLRFPADVYDRDGKVLAALNTPRD